MRRFILPTLAALVTAVTFTACIREADHKYPDDDYYEEIGNDNWYVDNDGDGWSEADGDCDDGWRYTYPGAPEYRDGEDQDCDGRIDEGCESDDDWNEYCD